MNRVMSDDSNENTEAREEFEYPINLEGGIKKSCWMGEMMGILGGQEGRRGRKERTITVSPGRVR